MTRFQLPKDRLLEIQVPASFFSAPLMSDGDRYRMERMLRCSRDLKPLTPANTAKLLKELTS